MPLKFLKRIKLSGEIGEKKKKRIGKPKNIFSWWEEWIIYPGFQVVKWSPESNQNPQLAPSAEVESKFTATDRVQELHTENLIYTLA